MGDARHHQPARKETVEHGNRRIYGVGSHYHTTTSEDTPDELRRLSACCSEQQSV
jgi:hypothetical protein